VADPVKARVLFLFRPQSEYEGKVLDALWELDSKSGSFKKHLELYCGDFCWGSRVQADGRVILAALSWAITFDLRQDRAEGVYAAWPQIGPSMKVANPRFKGEFGTTPPYKVIGGSLWATKPLCRVSPDTGRIELVHIGDASEFRGWFSAVEPIGTGDQVLFVQDRGLWVLTVPAQPPAKP
jgi:hypothetical protein